MNDTRTRRRHVLRNFVVGISGGVALTVQGVAFSTIVVAAAVGLVVAVVIAPRGE